VKYIVSLILIFILNFSCTQRWSAEEKDQAKKDCVLHPYGEFVSAEVKIEGHSGQSQAELDSIKNVMAKNYYTAYCDCLMDKLSKKVSYEDYRSGAAVMDSSYAQAVEECSELSDSELE
jgi:hypothetical protein